VFYGRKITVVYLKEWKWYKRNTFRMLSFFFCKYPSIIFLWFLAHFFQDSVFLRLVLISSTRSFYTHWSQKRKKTTMSWLSFFALLGSAHIQATHKKLVKLTLGVNFINMLTWSFYRGKCFDTKFIFHPHIYAQFHS